MYRGIIVGAILSLGLTGFMNMCVRKEVKTEEVLVTMDIDTIRYQEMYLNETDFDTIALKDYLTEVNMQFPDIVYAQAVLETGNFNSELFQRFNNLFGMKIAKQRPTLNKGEHPIYSSYYSWQHSVIDYAWFQSRFMKAYDTREKYLERLGEIYAEDPTYVSKLKEIINR